MSIESAYIWMDGEFVPFHDAKVHILSHSLHYGLGVFEGIRSYEQPGGGGGVFKLDEHLRRLLDSAKMCRMDVQYSLEELREACLATLAKNEFSSAYIRPLVHLGMGGMGLGARNNPVHTSVTSGSGVRTSEMTASATVSAWRPVRSPGITSTRTCSAPRSRVTT